MLEERIQTITKELSHWYLNNLIIKRKMHRTSTSKGSEKDSDDEKRPPQDPFKKIDNSHYTPKKKKKKNRGRSKSEGSRSSARGRAFFKSPNLEFNKKFKNFDNLVNNLSTLPNTNLHTNIEKTNPVEKINLNIEQIEESNEKTSEIISTTSSFIENSTTQINNVIENTLNSDIKLINNNMGEINRGIDQLSEGLLNYKKEVKIIIEASNNNIFTNIHNLINGIFGNIKYLVIGGGLIMLVIGGIAAYLYFRRPTSSTLQVTNTLLTEQTQALTQQTIALLAQSQALAANMHQNQQPISITIQQPQVERRFWRTLGNLILKILEEWLESNKAKSGRKDYE